jgi:hypothetical protein
MRLEYEVNDVRELPSFDKSASEMKSVSVAPSGKVKYLGLHDENSTIK